MDNKEEIQKAKAQETARRNRINRMKRGIIATAVLLILIPLILCVLMMFKINKLEDEIDKLTEIYALREDDTKEVLSGNTTVAHAAETGQEEDQKGEDTSKSSQSDLDASGTEDLVLTPSEKQELTVKGKKVYLTFDDGPGKHTAALLDVLKKYDVKATFFVVGKTDENAMKMYQRIVNEGHTLGMHSYSHQYSNIYKSLKAFDEDFTKLSNLLYDTTGVRPVLYRFPGGSSNMVSTKPMTDFIGYLEKKGITYFDWNVINGDATGKNLSARQMVDNVMKGVADNRNSIVLMHDTASRDTTVKSLPSLIKQLREEKYVILPITQYTKAVQHIKADSVK